MLLLILFFSSQFFDRPEYFSRKNRLFDGDSVYKFIEYSQGLRKEFPEELEIYFGLAEGYLRLDSFNEATSNLKEALKIKTDESVLRRAILLLDDFGRLRQEIEIFRTYRKLKKDNYLYPFEVAHLYERLKEYKAAAVELFLVFQSNLLSKQAFAVNTAVERIVNLYKSDKEILTLIAETNLEVKIKKRILGNIYLTEGRYGRALSEYIDTGDNQLLLSFANMCREKNLDSLALICYERLGLIAEAAQTYMQQGNYSRAIELFETRKNIKEDVLYAECLIKTGELKEASKILERILQQAIPPLRAYFLVEEIYLKKNEYARAESILSVAATRVPRDSIPFIFYDRANLYLYQGRLGDAATSYNGLVSRFPASPIANDALDKLLIFKKALGDTQAIKAYGRACFYARIDSLARGVDTTKWLIKKFPILAADGYRLLVDYYLSFRQYGQALGTIGEFEDRMVGNELLGRMLLIKSAIYIEIKEKIKAKQTLERIILNFGAAPEVAIAREMLKGLE